MSAHPPCVICGQPYLRHMEVVGIGRVCPVQAVTYRAPNLAVTPSAQLPDIILEAQQAADMMRGAAVALPDRFPEIKGMLEGSARIVETLCDELAKAPGGQPK